MRALQSLFRNRNQEVEGHGHKIYTPGGTITCTYFSRTVGNEPRKLDVESGDGNVDAATVVHKSLTDRRSLRHLRLPLCWGLCVRGLCVGVLCVGGWTPLRRSVLQAAKDNIETQPITWLILPALFQHLPYAIWEPSALRSLGMVTIDNSCQDPEVTVLGE